MSSIMNFSLEYWHLAVLEAVVLVIVCALTFRKPECITLASGSTVERPRRGLKSRESLFFAIVHLEKNHPKGRKLG